jgi:hypothetical protein
MNKNLKKGLVFCAGLVLLLAAVVILLLLPPVQKFILLRALPEGTTVGRVQVGLAGGALDDLRMPLEGAGSIHIPEANFRYKPFQMLTASTVHLTYLRARHIAIELPVASEPMIADEAVASQPDMKSLSRDLGDFLSELETIRFKWFLGELAVDGTLLQPDIGLFRFEIYGEGVAPGETGRFRTKLESINFIASDGWPLSQLVTTANIQFSQSSNGAIERLELTAEALGQNTASQPVVVLNANVDFAFAGMPRRPMLKLNADAHIDEPSLFGETLSEFKDLGMQLAIDLDAAGESFTLNEADLSLLVDGQPRLLASLEHAIRIDEVLPADLELFRLEFLELPLEWGQFFAAEGFYLTGSPLSARLMVLADGSGGFIVDLPELNWSPISLKNASGELLLEDLSLRMAMAGSFRPGDSFDLTLSPMSIMAGQQQLLDTTIALSGHLGDNDLLLLETEFSINADGIRLQPFASDAGELIPFEWKSLRGETKLEMHGGRLKVEQLQAQLHSQAQEPIMVLSLEQLFELSLDDFKIQLADPARELARLDFNQMRLSAMNPFLPEGIRIRDEGLSGKLLVEAKDQSFLVRLSEPLRLANLSVSLDGEPLLRQVDVAMDLVAELSSGHLSLPKLEIKLASLGDVLFEQTLSLELPLVDWVPSVDAVEFDGKLDANLARLGRQPILASIMQPVEGIARAQFNGSGMGQSLDLDFQLNDLRAVGEAPLRLAGNASLANKEEGVWSINSALDWGLSGEEKRSSIASRLVLKTLADVFDLTGEIRAPLLRVIDLQALQGVWVASEQAPDPMAQPLATVTNDSFPAAPWAGFTGKVSVLVDSLELPNGVPIKSIAARAMIDEDMVRLSDGKAQLGRGVANVSGKLERKPELSLYDLVADVSFNGVEPGFLMGRPAMVQGTFDGKIRLHGQGGSPAAAIEAAEVVANIEGRDGLMTLLNLESPATGAAMIGLSLLGSQTRQPGIAAFSRAIPYFNELRFNRFGLDLRRASDGLLELNELALVGPDLSLGGQGRVAAGKWEDMLDQPMRLTIDLGARGQLAESLQTLGLVRPTAGSDGFQQGTQSLNIGGTLARPDSKAVQDWLWQAAIGAFTGGRGQSSEPGSNQSRPAPEKTDARPRDEQRVEEIDIGRRLIEGLFGR